MCFHQKCPDFLPKMSGILDPRIPPFRRSVGSSAIRLNSIKQVIYLCTRLQTAAIIIINVLLKIGYISRSVFKNVHKEGISYTQVLTFPAVNMKQVYRQIIACYIVPVNRLEAFRGLKLSKSESFTALKFSRFGHFLTLKLIGQIGGFQGPKILQIGEFQGPKRLISCWNHYF